MADQAPPTKLSFKDRLKKKGTEVTAEFIATVAKEEEPTIQEVVGPFDANGKKVGNWIEKYAFGEWYYDLKYNPVFISPANDTDLNGDLYDQNSNFITDLETDEYGEYLPVILRNIDG